ncbi:MULTISPECIES: 2-oxoglutarate dehydrogenase complex dihydrolipoyllysine-residue succinyltransferase [Chitinophagaceae]
MIEIKVPTVGESISEVTLVKWVKKTGDYVNRDEVIAELESEKATFEVNAEQAGILETVANEDDTLKIGDVLAKIDETAAKPATSSDTTAAASAETAAPQTAAPVEEAKAVGKGILDLKVPTVGESISEVTLVKWLKKTGDLVKRDEPIAELESEKATFEVNAEDAGKLETVAKEDEVLKIGDVLAKIDTDVAVPTSAAPAPAQDAPKAPAPSAAAPRADVKASPVASAIIADKNVNTKNITPSGFGGKIMKNDVLEALANPGKQTFEGQDFFSRNERVEKMSNLRKTISKRLVEAKNTTAMLTTFNEVDLSKVMEIRSKFKVKFKDAHGVGLGFMSFFSKACAIALSEWPAVNAYIDTEKGMITYHDYADISIAVSTPKGLTVPVIRNVESLSLADIEKAVIELATKARNNKLGMEELTGGTFTITNGGVFGSMLSTPIINLPQSAILGMHNIIERPIAVNGKVEIRPMMYIALSYDHRIVDGRESVSFLVRIKELLENPELLLFRQDPIKTLLEL